MGRVMKKMSEMGVKVEEEEGERMKMKMIGKRKEKKIEYRVKMD